MFRTLIDVCAHSRIFNSFLQGFLRLERSGQKDDKFGNPARTGDFQQGSNLGANHAQVTRRCCAMRAGVRPTSTEEAISASACVYFSSI